MGSSDWLGPDWVRDAMRAWTPTAVPAPFTEAFRQVVDLFGFAPAMVAKDVIEGASARLVGRALTLRYGGTEVDLVLRVLRMARPPVGLMIGQLGDVEIEAEDVRWAGGHVARLRVDARNIHIQPGPPPTLVVAPIRLAATLDESTVDDMVSQRVRWAEVRLTSDGAAQVSLVGRRRWGHVDFVPQVQGDSVALEPRQVVIGGRSRASGLAQRLPHLRFRLPDAVGGHRLSDIRIEDGRVAVRAVVDEWRQAFSPEQLEQVVRRIQRFRGPLLDIPRGF
ncbi:MAG TPA: hypothetical protein VK360_08565 [Acidimicrobiales bacterium]|nr:hypothetical protein [Acidimicrobiales bacterium]